MSEQYGGILDRLIDAAVAHTEGGLLLAFKLWQQPTLALSPSGSLDGPFEVLGAPEIEGVENYQFLQLEGVWHLMATRLSDHAPALYRADPDGDWLRWERTHIFDIPREGWNDEEPANAGFLCDARQVEGEAGGWFYLFYGGSDELDSFEGRGHAKLGVARSADLQTWITPPGP